MFRPAADADRRTRAVAIDPNRRTLAVARADHMLDALEHHHRTKIKMNRLGNVGEPARDPVFLLAREIERAIKRTRGRRDHRYFAARGIDLDDEAARAWIGAKNHLDRYSVDLQAFAPDAPR